MRCALAIAIALFLSSPAARAEPIFVHWGWLSGNGELLLLGGVADGGDHAHGLRTDAANANFNAAVFAKMQEWYEREGRPDAAGPGFYFSSDVESSRGFGNDLLIMELVPVDGNKTPPPIEVRESEAVKALGNAALDAKDFSGAPWLVRYGDTWHVMLRPPNAEESRSYRVEFRAPTEHDVVTLWKQSTLGKSAEQVLNLLNRIGDDILEDHHPTSAEYKHPEPSARMALHRLFFDHGAEYLHELDWNKAAVKSSAGLSRVLDAYFELLPDDPRTRDLFLRWFDAVALSGHTDPDATLLNLERGARFIPEDRKPDVFRAVFERRTLKAGEKIAPRIASKFLSLYDELEPYAPDAASRAKAKALIKQMMRQSAEGHQAAVNGQYVYRVFTEEASSVVRTFQLVRKHFGADDARAMIDGRLGVLFGDTKGVVIWADHNIDKFHYFDQVFRAALAASLPDDVAHAEAMIDRAVAAFASDAHMTRDLYGIVTPILFARDQADPTLRQRLFTALDASIRKHYASLSKVSDLHFLYEIVLHDGMSPEEFEAMVKEIALRVPSLRTQAIDGLSWMVKTKDQRPIDWARIIQEVKALPAPPESLAGRLKTAWDDCSFDLYGPDRVSFKTFSAGVTRAWENIAGSPAYSELSRIFLLVDPVYVSEDLRGPLQARQPQYRFNENVQLGGRTLRQPAWENFNVAWTEFASDKWRQQKATLRKDAVEHEMYGPLWSANQLSIATGTDGAGLPSGEAVSHRWDRSRFPTTVTRAEWDALGGEANRADLERFFTIHEDAAGVHLRFKEEAELRASFPAIISDFRHESFASRLAVFVSQEAVAIKDPVARAAHILYLWPKLHPFEFGNGRLARMWAAQELVQAGLPMPVGLPTNDFFMSEARLRLEVRKAVKLGAFWQEMLSGAARAGIAPDDFFQKVYRGSALEGLTHIDPKDSAELEAYVGWLERQSAPPEWAVRFLPKVESTTQALSARTGKLAETSEAERFLALDDAWREFRDQEGIDFSVPADPALVRIRKAFANALCGLLRKGN